MNYSIFSKTAIEAAKKASDILQEGYTSSYKIFHKDGVHNLVTEYDFLAEKTIIETIKANYPDHDILSEEKGEINNHSDYKWIIDPLDGTVNFAHRIPAFGVSIGLAFQGEIIIAAIYLPITNELFTAEKGQGAYLNSKPIHVSQNENFKESFLATGFTYQLQDNPYGCIERFVEIIKTPLPLRRIGCAAMDLAYVACGRFDGFWHTGLGPWDSAAGSLLITEAGGKISTWDDKPFNVLQSKTLTATNGKIHAPLCNILKKGLI
ncbi:MAG TPA: inositol monophosphatase family protein [Chlamydiales bacterium]|nr:inositol monophosphatase family protein [Chlamydiales bacterium]